MADGRPPGLSRADAVARLGRWLEGTVGAEPLDPGAVPAKFSYAWKFSIAVENKVVELVFLVDDNFPRSRPRVGFAEPPKFPSYPHVEADGLICVLSTSDLLDPENPVGIATQVLAGAADILEQGFSGANEDDFRSEFLTYWNTIATGDTFASLLEPCGPTRTISIWPGKKSKLIAEDDKEIRRWLRNRNGKNAVAQSRVDKGLLIWLDRPLLPREYPETPEALRDIAVAAGAEEAFNRAISRSSGDTLIVFGADAGNGICFAGVTLMAPAGGRRRNVQSKGFRPGNEPAALKLNRAMRGRVILSAVNRADPWWIHGRDANPDVTELRIRRVALIGCGSLGSPIARLLAQAGVDTLDLIDPERLAWANTSRHALGAASVHLAKADQLAAELGRAFPHSNFNAHKTRWQDATDVLSECDLIISTIGSWVDEAALNFWQLAGGGVPIIYGWSEPHGVAGHAAALGSGSGCFQCGLTALGEALDKVVEWPGATLLREPACGAHFQPYGATAIMMSAIMVADLALDFLLARAPLGAHRIVTARRAIVEPVGGAWSDAWTAVVGAGNEGGQMQEFNWPRAPTCPACQGQGVP